LGGLEARAILWSVWFQAAGALAAAKWLHEAGLRRRAHFYWPRLMR
jgi:hypothetical protein